MTNDQFRTATNEERILFLLQELKTARGMNRYLQSEVTRQQKIIAKQRAFIEQSGSPKESVIDNGLKVNFGNKFAPDSRWKEN